MLSALEKTRARKRAHYLANRERLLVRQREYSISHREDKRAYDSRRHAENPGRMISRVYAYQKLRRKLDPEFRATLNLRRRVSSAIAGQNKSAPTMELLGCTIPELRAHLEAKFKPGMTWENYGPVWHIDHIRPCAKFNLLDPDQQRECFNFKNLQPLFAEENLKKGSK